MAYLIIIGILVAYWVFLRMSDAFGDWATRRTKRFLRPWFDARRSRLRAAERAAGRPPGSPVAATTRLKAAAIDVTAAAVFGLLIAIGEGQRHVTVTYYFADGHTTTRHDGPALWVFLLATVVAYGAQIVPAIRNPHSQTPGQNFYDYTTRAVDGHAPAFGELLLRQFMRLAAGPAALIAAAQAQPFVPLHDAWTGTTAATLGDDVAEETARPVPADTLTTRRDAAARLLLEAE